MSSKTESVFLTWTASSEFGIYRLCEQWIKRNLQTESQIPGPFEWLGMLSWNLSWRNARRHKFAWQGSLNCLLLSNLGDASLWLSPYSEHPYIKSQSCVLTFLLIWAASWQNQQNDIWVQRRLRSALASAQSDLSLRRPYEEVVGPQLPTERTAKTDQTGRMPRLMCLRWAHR